MGGTWGLGEHRREAHVAAGDLGDEHGAMGLGFTLLLERNCWKSLR